MKPLVLFLVGPTAVGKSQIALKIAKPLNGEIISADSMQVYQGMDIGTAKPSKAERRRIPHHMIDIVSPARKYSVYQYRKAALKKIEEIIRRDRLPMVVGGSGLYVRALLQGLSPQPGSDPKIRKRLEKEAKAEGLHKLYERLRKLDPKRAKQIKAADEKRIVRALEILESSGEKPSQQHLQKGESLKALGYEPVVIGITRDRAILYKEIEERVEIMFKKGLVREVKKLLKGRLSRTALQAVGYKETLQALKGKISLEQAKELIKLNSRHLAKRQWTWFKREEGIQWIDFCKEEPAENVYKRFFSLMAEKKLKKSGNSVDTPK